MGGPEFLGVVKGGTIFISVFQTGDLNFLRMFFHWGGGAQKSFHKAKGGPKFFPVGKGGGPEFFTYAKDGDKKKLATSHQTD